MVKRTWLCAVAAGTIMLGSAMLYADDAPAAAVPATQPAQAGKTTISRDAKELLGQVASAYSKLKSLDLKGTLVTDIDASGKQQKQSMDFSASYSAPNKFRHAMQGDVLCGSTGTQMYIYLESRNLYRMDDAPKEKIATSQLPDKLDMVLPAQNPSLMLAMASDPAQSLEADVKEMSTGEPLKLADNSFPTLKLTMADKSVTTLAVDPSTHLLRQVVRDIGPAVVERGVPDVKKAVITIDYSASTIDKPQDDNQFAWAPPAGAKDAAKMADEAPGGGATALVGKPAPAFKLTGMDGKDVSLADHKGKVVLVDFWATWCGPCRMSLPHIQEIYEARKKDGLVGYAVDLAEEKAQVEKFSKSTKMTIPILLDTQGKTGEAYLADAIPETVLIGKDGKVKNVWIGVTEPSVISKAVDAALRE